MSIANKNLFAVLNDSDDEDTAPAAPAAKTVTTKKTPAVENKSRAADTKKAVKANGTDDAAARGTAKGGSGGGGHGTGAGSRAPKREFDRHSGTGRGTEMKKGGRGGHNWGSATDEVGPDPDAAEGEESEEARLRREEREEDAKKITLEQWQEKQKKMESNFEIRQAAKIQGEAIVKAAEEDQMPGKKRQPKAKKEKALFDPTMLSFSAAPAQEPDSGRGAGKGGKGKGGKGKGGGRGKGGKGSNSSGESNGASGGANFTDLSAFPTLGA